MWEPHIVAWCARFLRPGMTVVDVGANIGFHALHAACRVGPEGRVLAFEPDPRNAALLRMSLGLRSPRLPVEVIEAALSDRDGTLVLSDLGNPGNSGARFTHESRGHLERLVHGPRPVFSTTSARRFDDHFDLHRLDLVKIDVEGFEPKALAGMEASIRRHRPAILTEFAPSNLRDIGGIDPAGYIGWFLERGYTCAILEEPGDELTPASARDAMARIAGDRHHVDLVLTPVDDASQRPVR
jgi:FkbM family methyltransferase